MSSGSSIAGTIAAHAIAAVPAAARRSCGIDSPMFVLVPGAIALRPHPLRREPPRHHEPHSGAAPVITATLSCSLIGDDLPVRINAHRLILVGLRPGPATSAPPELVATLEVRSKRS